MPHYKVSVDRLREGVFISLDLKWFEHPFLFSSFKITKPEQLAILRELGISSVVCIPEKSDVLPLPQSSALNRTPEQVAATLTGNADSQKLWELKKERIQRLRERRAKDAQCEKQFAKSLDRVKHVMRDIESGSKEAFEESDRLMKGIVESLMPEKESAVQLMNTKFGKENVFFHSLNVSVLSMMLGREYGFDAEAMRLLGLGALFHDIGKSRVPKSILHKTTPLTRAEQAFYQLHPKYGGEILSRLEGIPPEVLDIVFQHHERNDGKGFPRQLEGEQISILARIVCLVNVYDNHCNKFNPADSMTPHEALAYMFSIQKDSFDKELLALFIQCLGVYPPGTIVKLSNGFTGMVITVNPRDPLHPSLLMYNPEIPKQEALVIDLRDEPGFSIEGSLKPAHLPQEVFDYLSPRTRVTYYVAESDGSRRDIPGGGG